MKRWLVAPRHTYWLVVAVLVLVALLVRIIHLSNNPSWDGDEGYNYSIALNLSLGRAQEFALSFAFVQHPPLFFAFGALFFKIFGTNLLALRLASVTAAVITTVCILPLSREVSQLPETEIPIAGLLAAALFAVLPIVVTQTRFAYTYNLLSLFSTVAVIFILRARRTKSIKNALLAAGCVSLALITDQEAIYLLPVLLIVAWGLSKKIAVAALLVSITGTVVYVGTMAITRPAILRFDILHTAGRVNGGSFTQQAVDMLVNLTGFLSFDIVLLTGLLGLSFIFDRHLRRLVLVLVGLMLLVILKIRDPNPNFRTAEPFLPFVCLGLGLVGERITYIVKGRQARRTVAVFFILVFSGFLVSDIRAAFTQFPTSVLTESTADATTVAHWTDQHAKKSDLIIAMPQIAWLFHERTADILQTTAIMGLASGFYPADIDPSRWAYDAHIDSASFIVVDKYTHLWAEQSPPEMLTLSWIQARWTPVYRKGEYVVYANPMVKE